MKKHKKIYVVIAIVFLLLFLAQSNLLYLTGYGYYDLCWNAQHGERVGEPKTPAESLRQASQTLKEAQCEDVVKRTIYQDGYILSGNPEFAVTPELASIQFSCPSQWSDVPMGGLSYLVINLIQDKLYINFFDRFLPAKYLIRRIFRSEWPNCNNARLKAGIPIIIEKKENQWDFDGTCKPCEDEKAAYKNKGNK
jgi:hypothetical protein